MKRYSRKVEKLIEVKKSIKVIKKLYPYYLYDYDVKKGIKKLDKLEKKVSKDIKNEKRKEK